MQFAIDKIVNDYGEAARRIVPYEVFVYHVMVRDYYGIVSSLVRRSLLMPNLHALILDCDCDGSMMAACHWIKTEMKLGYTVIISSPNHYWIVVDMVGSWSKIHTAMTLIPGVDKRYTQLSDKRRCSYIRAVPKANCVPKFQQDCLEQLRHPLAREWLWKYKSYIESEDFRKICKAVRLRQAVEDGTISELAANPEFAM